MHVFFIAFIFKSDAFISADFVSFTKVLQLCNSNDQIHLLLCSVLLFRDLLYQELGVNTIFLMYAISLNDILAELVLHQKLHH